MMVVKDRVKVCKPAGCLSASFAELCGNALKGKQREGLVKFAKNPEILLGLSLQGNPVWDRFQAFYLWKPDLFF
jgi:hypothetical protein